MTRLPTLFVSHGAPDIVLRESAARAFLEAFGRTLPRPRAILVVSAHFESRTPLVTIDEHPETIYDFGNFAPALRRLTYPAPGDPALVRRVADLLRAAHFPVEFAANRGFDHGAWTPLMLLFPEADIPVVQLSIQPEAGPEHHRDLGRTLAPLRNDGVLILASGALTHNLAAYFGTRRGRGTEAAIEPEPWVETFATWVNAAVAAGRVDDLLDYRRRAPSARENHPTEEHLLPLFVALGAAEGETGRRVHASHDGGVLAMDAYAFGEVAGVKALERTTALAS
ncbi:MAG TPA: class III extradiol ring-cleavage dioxygenase [Beijerinckiaceae bacterium]|jgi:4,5-DOPA dioxygenase extradiol